MLTSASFYGSLVWTILVLLLGFLLSRKWTRSGPTRAVRKRRIALALIITLVLLTLWTDWPSNLFSLRAFWRDHALVDGTLVALLLLSSGYLVLDLTLENARDARDKACLEDIRQMTQEDHIDFWALGIELVSKLPRDSGFLPVVQYVRDTALASHRTLALSAEVSMSMQSEEGMELAKSAVHAFAAVGHFITVLQKAALMFEMESLRSNSNTYLLAHKAQDVVQKAHDEAYNSYADLVEAAGGKSAVREEEERHATDG